MTQPVHRLRETRIPLPGNPHPDRATQGGEALDPMITAPPARRRLVRRFFPGGNTSQFAGLAAWGRYRLSARWCAVPDSPLKGLVIINGCNHHPADVAATAERAVPVARPSHVAAFAVDAPDGEGQASIIEVKTAHVRRHPTGGLEWLPNLPGEAHAG
ncbi:hypothetical protein ABZ814_20495 [Micromonospora musae]|uniref:hypothetical protein n=1 Tax=Micromonospora musae TaxID=1894970 RepID=UPI003403225B